MSMQIWMICGAFLSIVLGTGRFVRKNRGNVDVLQAILFFLFSLSIINYILLWSGYFLIYPHFLGVAAPILSSFGCIYWMSIKELEQADTAHSRNHWIPILLVTLAFSPLYIQDAKTKVLLQQGQFIEASAWLNAYLVWAEMLLLTVLLSYSFAIVFRLTFHWKEKSVASKARRLTLSFAILLVAFLLSLMLFRISGNDILFKQIFACSPFLVLAFYLLGERYVEYRKDLGAGLKATRKSASRLGGVDGGRLILDLKRLMIERSLFKEENVTLDSVSEIMNINKHQLSELINTKLKVNFNAFLNKYRVDEAKRLLETKPSKAIIDVATEAGFGSKSVFNRVFKSSTGYSPSEYRKQVRANQEPGHKSVPDHPTRRFY